ncbi:unnamed protein product [Sphagnum troendelagicum]|uniref:Phytocyanin domain-containing protein n=1 Tax=Sphagnum troendelagicum TaxID=128251 RepID=A0ABP0V6X1_9BRYO
MPSTGAQLVGGTTIYPMRMRSQFCMLLLGILANLLSGIQATELHAVGGFVGWSVPPSGQTDWYSEVWAKSISFQVGDVLVFSYSPDDNVYELADEADFAACKLDTIGVWYSGSTNITLTKAGTYYFVCGNEDQCKLGMKLRVKVEAEEATTTIFTQILSGLRPLFTRLVRSITDIFHFSPSYYHHPKIPLAIQK